MGFRTLRSKCALLAAVCLLVLGVAGRASADSISLEWDPSGSDTGYRVHVGTQPGSYTQHFDVGAQTAFTLATAIAGQRYCFAVSAYSLSSLLEGPNSTEVCGYSNAPPTLVNPGNRTSTAGQAVTLQLAGADPESQPLTYSATGLPPGITLMASTGYVSGAGTTAGTYNVTASASDGALTASQTFTWAMGAAAAPPPPTDTTRPTASISTPTNGTAYSTSSATIAMSGEAADNVGVTQVRWSNNRGGSGVANGTTNWNLPGISLATGDNLIIITAVDAAGNQGTDSVTVTFSATTITPDTTRPTVSVRTPTTGTLYSTTSSTISMSGDAADNVGVAQVRWSNDRGGSGVASGTTGWSLSGIALATGDNLIVVTAVDAAGNQGTDYVTVTRSSTGTTGGTGDAIAPATTISSPTTDSTYTTSSIYLPLSGSATDNVRVTQVRWTSDRGGFGVATGTTSWRLSGILLQPGTNVITIIAVDAAGNQGTDTITVSRPGGSGGSGGGGGGGTGGAIDTTSPTVAITAPTTAGTYQTSVTYLPLSGTATDNVGVKQVLFSTDRGGNGVATGTTNWRFSGILLQPGTNVITIIAVDAAGNRGTTTLTVTR